VLLQPKLLFGSCYSTNPVFQFLVLGYSTGLAILTGLLEILSHSKLIPDATVTITLARMRYSEIQSQ